MTISLIIPCFNEEVNIAKGVLDKIGNFTKNDKRFTEVIIIDDGSTDQSKKIIQKKYLSQYSKFRLIENNHQGKAYAIITGILASKAQYVFFSDFDLATPIEETEKLIAEAKKGNDIVIGSRKRVRKGAPFLRKLMAVGFIFIRNAVIGLKNLSDTQCGFKLFKRTVALILIDKLRVFHDMRKKAVGSSVTAGFDLELLFLAMKLKYRVKEVPVIWNHVETKRVNFIKDSLEALSDIIKIKWYEINREYK